MAILIRDTMRPNNASCGWSTACAFWRGGSDVAPVEVEFAPVAGAVRINESALGYGGYAYGGGLPVLCSQFGYVTEAGSSLCRLKVWKALADGAWSGSISVNILISYSSAIGTLLYVRARGSPGSPATQSIGVTAKVNPYCNDIAHHTATFYDDGTFTLS